MRISFSEFGPDVEVPLTNCGDVQMPAFTVATVEEPGAHTVKVAITVSPVGEPGPDAVWRPGVEFVELHRNHELPPITSADLRRVPLERLVRAVIAQRATGEPGAVMDAAASLRRRRSEVSDERLAAVAAAWREDGVDAVTKRLHVGRSQAYRLVQRARAAGHLDDESTD